MDKKDASKNNQEKTQKENPLIGLRAKKLPDTAPPAGAAVGEGVALDRDPEAEPAPITVPDTDREGHIFTMGATRSGKTRLAEAMIEHDIRAGRSILWIDPKGDNAIFSKIVTVARETGREDDLLFFSPVHPRYSVKIDPLSHYFMPEEVVNHVVSGVRVREEFYFNIAYEVTLVVVQGLMLISRSLGERPAFTFRRIKENIGYRELEGLRAQIAGIEGPEAEEILVNLDQILSSPQDYFSKVSSSLRTVIMSLSSGSVGEIIGKDTSNRFIFLRNEDNESPPPPPPPPTVTVSFDSSFYSVSEGEAVTVGVTLSADPERTVTVPLIIDRRTTADSGEYSLSSTSVTFASGEISKNITLTATDDDLDDDDESVVLGFGTLPEGVSAGGRDRTTITILDNDVAESGGGGCAIARETGHGVAAVNLLLIVTVLFCIASCPVCNNLSASDPPSL